MRHAVERPIEQKVLDPACGSGTFLFHAIRNFIKEAEEAGLEERLRAQEATNHVAGMDIHPVAVIIARVTYLLALAPVIAKRAGSLSIPVYLGDAMQLSTAETMNLKELVIRVPPPPEGTDLKFPEIFCKDIHLFDKLVAQMRQGSEQKPKKMSAQQIERAFQREIEQHYKRDMTKAESDGVREMVATYVDFDKLREQGRDSVWTYVARNLSRPLALSFGTGWANVVVGNPPWLAFRYMSADLQKRFRSLANGERVYVGGRFATQNDLSALFLVRAAALYLRSGGRIAFVMPLAALTRGQFEKFRKGSFSSARIAWDEAWTMDDDVQPLFPVPSCVVFGLRRATAKSLPDTVRAYSGQLPMRDASEAQADAALKVQQNAPKPAAGRFTGGSAYRKSFRQGATLVPRMLCLVERKNPGPARRRSDCAFRRQPPQQSGKKAVEVASWRGASDRGRVFAPRAAGRKHFALSGVAAFRRGRTHDPARVGIGRRSGCKSRLLRFARLDVRGRGNLEFPRRKWDDEAY